MISAMDARRGNSARAPKTLLRHCTAGVTFIPSFVNTNHLVKKLHPKAHANTVQYSRLVLALRTSRMVDSRNSAICDTSLAFGFVYRIYGASAEKLIAQNTLPSLPSTLINSPHIKKVLTVNHVI
jgi:hypothetical protein